MQDPTAMLYDLLAQNTQALEDMRKSLEYHMKETRENEEANSACRAKMLSSVPDGDHEGHRRYHEAVIKKMESRARMWSDISTSVAKWGVIGVLTWLMWAIWHEFILTVFRSMGKS